MSEKAVNVQLMQRSNRIKVLSLIRRYEVLSRPQISEMTGLSLSSVTNIINYLLSKSLVSGKGVEDVSRVGRKADLIVFDHTSYRFVLINVQSHEIAAYLTDMKGGVLSETKEVLHDLSPANVETVILAMTEKLSDDDTIAVGITASGFVDGGRICSSSLGWDFVDLQSPLENKIKQTVFVENTTIAKAAYEFYCKGEMSGANSLFVDLEGGIGAVRLFGGEINRASTGEIGHTIVRTGPEAVEFLEELCSIPRLEKRCGRSFDEIEALAMSTGEYKRELDECLDYLTIGLANLINIYNPALIAINGDRYFKSKYPFDFITKGLDKYLFAKPSYDIRSTEVSTDGALEGLAGLVCDYVISRDTGLVE